MQNVTLKNDVAWTVQAITGLSIHTGINHQQRILNLNSRSTQSSLFLMAFVILYTMILE
jgi:hypothetical protein